MRMEDAITEAVEQTIFPLARGSSEARSVGQLKNCHLREGFDNKPRELSFVEENECNSAII